MLRSLEIRNYRNLRHLTIEKLGRVNLLVGKNNTGKTSVLEAVNVFVSEGSLSVFQQLIEERGYSIRNGTWEDSLKSYSSLFTDRPYPIYSRHVLSFKAKTSDSDIEKEVNLDIKIVGYVDRFEKDSNDQYQRSSIILDDIAEMYENNIDAQLALEVNINGKSKISHLFSYARTVKGYLKEDNIDTKCQFVKSSGTVEPDNDVLWDAITLTDNEEYVIKALQILDENVFRIAFIDNEYTLLNSNRSKERVAIARLRSTNTIVPLRSMGDGINRILTVILAMVNCEDGYLLVDEFENGLHYSVQEKLWEIIFYLAERLNIQVFATTHSNDTIKTFGEIANSKPEYTDAQLVQLRNVKGEISAVLFDTQDVEIASETDYLDLR